MSVHGTQYVDITAVNASGDLTSSQFYIVRCTGVDTSYSASNLTCKLCTSATGGVSGPRGVLQNEPDTGQAAIVRIFGPTKVLSGGAIGVGNYITSSTAGTAVVASSTGQHFIGWAMQAATSAGERIEAFLTGPGVAITGSSA